MHSEWSEKKFLKGSQNKTTLLKQVLNDRSFAHAAAIL